MPLWSTLVVSTQEYPDCRGSRCCGAAAIFSGILHGATLPTEARQGGGGRDGLDWWPAKGPQETAWAGAAEDLTGTILPLAIIRPSPGFR